MIRYNWFSATKYFVKLFFMKLKYNILYSSFKNNSRSKTILFYPEFPHKKTVIFKILKYLKVYITNNPKGRFDCVIKWKDTTINKRYKKLDELSVNYKVINIHCNDNSKENVVSNFERIFGYKLSIDPLEFKGQCLKKIILMQCMMGL